MAGIVCAERDKFNLNYEETELRLGLGLPGGGANADGDVSKSSGKRGFSETVDLKLNLLSKESPVDQAEKMKEKAALPPSNDPAKPPAK